MKITTKITLSLLLGLALGFGIGRHCPRHHYEHYLTRLMVDTGTGQVCNPYGVWSWMSYAGYQRVVPAIELSAGLDTAPDTLPADYFNKAHTAASPVAVDFSKAQPIMPETHTASIADIQSVQPAQQSGWEVASETPASVAVGAPIPPCRK